MRFRAKSNPPNNLVFENFVPVISAQGGSEVENLRKILESLCGKKYIVARKIHPKV